MNWQKDYSSFLLANVPPEDRRFYERDLAIKRKHELFDMREKLLRTLGMSLDDLADILLPLLEAAKRRERRGRR